MRTPLACQLRCQLTANWREASWSSIGQSRKSLTELVVVTAFGIRDRQFLESKHKIAIMKLHELAAIGKRKAAAA